AGMEPAVAGERSSRGGLVVVVPGENGRSLDQDLAVGGDRELDAGDRGPDGAKLVVRGPVDGRRARLLGLAVALEDQDVEGVEELRDLLRERRAAGDPGA